MSTPPTSATDDAASSCTLPEKHHIFSKILSKTDVENAFIIVSGGNSFLRKNFQDSVMLVTPAHSGSVNIKRDGFNGPIRINKTEWNPFVKANDFRAGEEINCWAYLAQGGALTLVIKKV